MTNKTRAIFALLIGVPSLVGLFIFAGWKVALCIFLMLWAENIGNGIE